MQTFLPQTDSFDRIARELDSKRLHKQTLEGWQVLMALTHLNPANEDRNPKGWVNHPVSVMWRGHETLMVEYLEATYHEWIRRGFKSTMLPKIQSTYNRALELERISPERTLPWWMADSDVYEQIASTHRVALLRKDYGWYSQFGWQEDTGVQPAYYQYLWPDANGNVALGTYNDA